MSGRTLSAGQGGEAGGLGAGGPSHGAVSPGPGAGPPPGAAAGPAAEDPQSAAELKGRPPPSVGSAAVRLVLLSSLKTSEASGSGSKVIGISRPCTMTRGCIQGSADHDGLGAGVVSSSFLDCLKGNKSFRWLKQQQLLLTAVLHRL